MLKDIIVRGAREHNLKNINITLPREKFIVITGLSGSGKSTLAFDTIYAEGQRRYVESLSAYARQFLGLMNKPDLDSIEGLSPAISIEQKTTSKNPRSTVGTVTEIYDYLRLLFARIGKAHCPKCDTPIQPQSAENITNLLLSEEQDIILTAPLIRGVKGTHEKVLEKIKTDGYVRVRIDGQLYRLDEELPKLARYEKHFIEAVIDRVRTNEENRQRVNEAVEHALDYGKGVLLTIQANKKAATKEIERAKNETVYTSFGACPKHPEVVFEALEPRMFSFNSPFGACQSCLGLGEHITISPELLLDEEKSILDGGIKAYSREVRWRAQQLASAGFNITKPINKYAKKERERLLYGDGVWEGLVSQTLRLHKETESKHRKEKYERYMTTSTCDSCQGKRLKPNSLAVKIAGHNIIETTDMNIEESLHFFNSLELNDKEAHIAKQVLKEITDRLGFLYNVGLGYLNLSRSARTLSGGEAQRIRLATQIGSNLMGVLYILDEPSIGLHQRDNNKLIKTLHRLRDLGNTLIVVEHDEDTIRASDYVVDIGPGAGVHGGHIVAQGTPKQLMKTNSLTAQYLTGKKKIDTPATRRTPKEWIILEGCQENNLQNITAKLPTSVLCAITGVSGSGKSTLMNQTLIPILEKHFRKEPKHIGQHKKATIPKLDNAIVIDQDPIGKTPRSNPATYTKLFDDIRSLYAETKEARARGYQPGRFSFNVKGGRCETCQGDGELKIEMNFLPDVYVECEDCKGKRYNKETLQVTYKGKNIADVLDMTVEEALEHFKNHTNIQRKLQTLSDVGLDYIKLGQSATTFSGGESQRIKLTRELAKQKRGNTVYLLDEPTTGLHFEDVNKLLSVLQRLVNKGNTIYVIEHNLDVIKTADYIVDIGPEGGAQGGKIIAKGTPEEIITNKKSHTAKYLKEILTK